MPDISVLVPSYNHARFVERTLRSIFAQTVLPKKLIVIDDGSKDESVEIIERTLKECPFPNEFVVRENRGLCVTLNDGFARSVGEFFAYLGSDDLWLPTFLEEQSKLLASRTDAVLAFSHAYIIDENDNIFDRTDNWSEFADGDMLPTLLAGDIFSSPGVLYRRSALLKHRWNEQAALEDYEMYLTLTAEGEFARNRNLLCAWRQHGRNTSGDFPRLFNEQLLSQDRTADLFGLDRGELDKIQRRFKFKGVSNYIRAGFRREAFPLFRENFRYADSAGDLLFTAARLLTPTSLFRWNRARKRDAGIRKYGKLTI